MDNSMLFWLDRSIKRYFGEVTYDQSQLMRAYEKYKDIHRHDDLGDDNGPKWIDLRRNDCGTQLLYLMCSDFPLITEPHCNSGYHETIKKLASFLNGGRFKKYASFMDEFGGKLYKETFQFKRYHNTRPCASLAKNYIFSGPFFFVSPDGTVVKAKVDNSSLQAGFNGIGKTERLYQEAILASDQALAICHWPN